MASAKWRHYVSVSMCYCNVYDNMDSHGFKKDTTDHIVQAYVNNEEDACVDFQAC